MSTSFSSLPIISLAALCSSFPKPEELAKLSTHLDSVFSTTGFAYLTDLPLSYTHDDVFGVCDEFFGTEGLSSDEKMMLAKKTFVPMNKNTYRGYFLPQLGADNFKEGFELGSRSSTQISSPLTRPKLDLSEPNVFPSSRAEFQKRCETLHDELQNLSARLLELLAVALGKPVPFFNHYLDNSLSTLRLLHYPPVPETRQLDLICTPHTDSGILTLLHQDKTGGLEVRNSEGEWIPAPYIPGSLVVNIGDLMSKVSGGKWVATFHRVRSSKREGSKTRGRYSVPFFFEPGFNCVVESVEGDQVIYGEHVLEKMKGWVEFQDVVGDAPQSIVPTINAVPAF
ncbi:hypothetical protein B2J93_5417 [Marssonina coronariae]|uniref:Fe2OG dioxygenase domain-containing protein n=1 Tax=Diplocarpon coronariae TaxID=2795749 RepID=A0A218YXT3_9HELO|nr:hypothetical protein B2J93_5417 [Marssonina coronariae]